jgi:hypothetical protein
MALLGRKKSCSFHYRIASSYRFSPFFFFCRTTGYVIRAIRAGFRGIDTACQPKHYREDLVGEALVTLASEYGIQREDIFLQTKFTPIDGQDLNQPLPYDRYASLPEQVVFYFELFGLLIFCSLSHVFN